MSENTIWDRTSSLLITYNYTNEDDLKEFRKTLDQHLNSSKVERVIIIVSIPKSINKDSLPPHFLIYYNSPVDYTFFGKLKDMQLKNELKKSFDLLLSFGKVKRNIERYIHKMNIAKKIMINAELINDPSYELELNSASDSPKEMINFVVQTLQKIDNNELHV
jgi:hypothetical protein